MGDDALDRIDLRILDCLQRDGRMSNLKLAESVALSPTAVLARVLTDDALRVTLAARAQERLATLAWEDNGACALREAYRRLTAPL